MKEYMDIGLPKNLTIEEFPEYIHISRKWFGLRVIFMTVFVVIWNAFLFNFYAAMDDDVELFAKLFPLIHVAVGIGFSYYALAGWLNKTHIYVSKNTMEIMHKPIPWPGHKKLNAADLKQLYVKDKVSRNKNGTTVTYEVHAILVNKTNVKLVSGLSNSEQALFIEQEIEKYLDIENVSVRGEVG